MQISKLKFNVCILVFIVLVFSNFVLAESLPDKQGIYYYPNTLLDVRDINIIDGSVFAITALGDDGNVYTSFYEIGNSHCLGTYQFEATRLEDIKNHSLESKKGSFYLPAESTDVIGVIYVGSETFLASRTDKGNVSVCIYEPGNSYPDSLYQFNAKDREKGEEELEKELYIPKEATDLIDMTMTEDGMIFTSKKTNGNLMMFTYHLDSTTSYELFEIKSSDEIGTGNLPNEEGIYYIPKEVGEIREVEINGQEIALITKTVLGDIVLIVFEKGNSLPIGIAKFEALPYTTVDNQELPDEYGAYYIADILTDISGAIVNSDNFYFLSELEDKMAITVYDRGNSYPTGYAVFEYKEPELCF